MIYINAITKSYYMYYNSFLPELIGFRYWLFQPDP